ncbi:DnaB-like helicase C-terminal domain-containing protein [Streptomyces triculaminicus]|uniref:DnaB-like helicase C-terminal domain-containing protein n=1 Tax=Streptomyces triculaminicus TaxID=2816232 RepID=UPI003793957D
MTYDCPVCLKPVHPELAGMLIVTGVTKDHPGNWVWGPYPVHEAPCRARLADPLYDGLIGTDGYASTEARLLADAPETRELLAHWEALMRSPFIDRTMVQHWSRGSDELDGLGMTPWPQMDDVVRLESGHLSCLGIRSRSREAQAGYDIAVDNAARGLRVALFAPDLTPRNLVPNLSIDQHRPLTTDYIRDVLSRRAAAGDRAQLVVIDRLQLMTTMGGTDAEGIGLRLKQLAMTEDRLGLPPILLLARLERPRRAGIPLDIEDLGSAADLEYHADTVALLDRTDPAEVNVLVAKDRSGPAPRRLTVSW